MAVVVEQTIPFNKDTLDLENAARWNELFPLIRPTVKSIQTAKGQNILVDMAKAKGKRYLHIVAAGSVGNFSSKLLDDKHVTAIITEKSGAGILTAQDLPHALTTAGIDVGHGLVMVRAGKERKINMHSPDVIEVEMAGELEQDHVLHLLGTATGGTRANPHNLAELLKVFVKNASTAHSKFHTAKVEDRPAVLHIEGADDYEQAKHAVQRDLKYAMRAHAAQEEDVVYSVHFSDVNGLSRLENYIIAGEIAEFLDTQNVKYALSHSTILNHTELARGFSIAICPIPVHFLEPSAKPKPHEPTGATSSSAAPSTRTLSSSKPKISFNDTSIRHRVKSACNAVISEEPTITKYDEIVGDGDCGYTLRDGAKKVLSFIADKDLTNLPSVVADLVSQLEIEMGGTSGALYCIYLTALANALATEESIAGAAKAALGELCKYTNARVGDRTMMDALMPFVETLEGSGDVKRAIEEARKGVDGTETMTASLGRSTYLDDEAIRGVPDPGAYGLLVLLEGLGNVN
ncbi:Dihydroxyacetone kinase 1 [Fulvia fulva]|uniref:Dihydroxyacetone kinase 1 n=1 Tax=Passalora fulva TaxID=5499 RepID=A0A9Q8LCF0_PASFU|nr:Dihydroxyacetone kinase 1 [Fulvia fulva]KAK4629319.1 Dihydroxyacetone kinase 1 [Fulvia fulva]KAK4630446.1 Dihydroxyacetone kinase 1 [Fulvia fulva]UJO14915.1 Dihydroxyacetone kinase 1 [Fulvia fulva]WPV12832.1 Dihydroxyacetone kinase 1 [Fulvia fulva]WPV27007.1 Dihydroxyacetone kinase 1 [Fulvia fulva]